MAPAMFVRRKSGKVRMCVNYKELNKRTVKGVHPLPQPDEMRDQLPALPFFSTLDLTSGYRQLPLHADD